MECNNSFSQDKLIICGEDFLWHSNNNNGYLCRNCFETIEAYASLILIVYNYKLYKLRFFRGYVYDMEFKNNCITEIKDKIILKAINEIAYNQYLRRIDNWRGTYKTHTELLKRLEEIPLFVNSNNMILFKKLNNELINSFNKLNIPLIIVTERTSNTCYNVIEYYTLKDLAKSGKKIIKNHQNLLNQIN